MWEVTLTLLEGFSINCLIFVLTLVFALPLGLVIAFGSMSKFKIISYPIKGIVWIIRGTPLMLQLIIFYYGPGLLWGGKAMDNLLTTILAFSINYACYFSEIYRSGIQSIPKGQYEAGLVLGMTKTQIFKNIILLQVVRRIIPPMGNEFITLIKDTSLARVIMVTEIIKLAENNYFPKGIIWPFFYTGVFYLIFIGILTLIFHYIEKKLNYYSI